MHLRDWFPESRDYTATLPSQPQVTRTNACVSDYACIRDKHGYHLGTPVVISWTYAPELTCGDLMSSLPME